MCPEVLAGYRELKHRGGDAQDREAPDDDPANRDSELAVAMRILRISKPHHSLILILWIGNAGNSGAPTHARSHPPGPASAERPQAEQAAYAARPIRRPPTAYPARPGGRPTDRRLAACLRTRKRASKKTPSAVRPCQPARYGAARTAPARHTAGGSRTRSASQPAPPRTRRPPPARQFHDPPKLGHSVQADQPHACPSGTPY